MDPLQQAKRELAIREAGRLYPEINPVLAGWVFDYIESIGQEEFERRLKIGFYDQPKEKVLE